MNSPHRRAHGHRLDRPCQLRATAATVFLALLAGACGNPGDDAVSVVVSIPRETLPFTKATVLVDYSTTEARILEEAGGPACAFILPGVEGDFSDDRRGLLTIRVRSRRGLRGPIDLAACRMSSHDEEADAAWIHKRLEVRFGEAEDAAGKPLDLNAKIARPRSSTEGGEAAAEAAQAQARKAAEKIGGGRPAAGGGAAANRPGAGGTPSSGQPGAPGAARGDGDASDAIGGPPSAMPGARPPASAPTAPPRAPAARPGTNGAVAGAPPPPIDQPHFDEDHSGPPRYDRDPNYDDSEADDPDAPLYEMTISVNSAGVIGALQLDISHLGSGGGFVGRGAGVECSPLVDALAAANYAGGRTVRIGLVSLQGIRTPSRVVRCMFRSRERVGVASFVIRVADAADTETNALNPLPNVVIESVVPR